MVKKIQVNISNKTFYTFVVAIVLIALGVVVYAQTPNPGHDADQIAPPLGCAAGEVLIWGNSDSWECNLAEELKQYVGVTSQSYTGSGVGNYDGGDDKCQAQYGSNARMCMGADFALGRPPDGINAWYSLFGIFDSPFLFDPNLISDCRGWTSNSQFDDGPRWVNGPNNIVCSDSNPIACCR